MKAELDGSRNHELLRRGGDKPTLPAVGDPAPSTWARRAALGVCGSSSSEFKVWKQHRRSSSSRREEEEKDGQASFGSDREARRRTALGGRPLRLLLMEDFALPPQLVDILPRVRISRSRGVFIFAGRCAARPVAATLPCCLLRTSGPLPSADAEGAVLVSGADHPAAAEAKAAAGPPGHGASWVRGALSAMAQVKAFTTARVHLGFLLYSSYQLLASPRRGRRQPEVVTRLLGGGGVWHRAAASAWSTAARGAARCSTTMSPTPAPRPAVRRALRRRHLDPPPLAVASMSRVRLRVHIAAVAGLRSLYQLLSVAVSDLVYRCEAVALVRRLGSRPVARCAIAVARRHRLRRRLA